MGKKKKRIQESDALFMLSGAGVLGGIFVVGYFFFFSVLAQRLVPWPVFFALFGALAVLNIFLLLQFWKRRFAAGIGWQLFMLLWGPLALWYWLFAPVYYYFTVNIDVFQISLLGFIYLWEVPLVGGIFIALAIFRFRHIKHFTETRQTENPESLYRSTFHYPIFVAIILFLISIIGYGIGTIQLNAFGQLPALEQAKSLANGFVVSIFLSLFYYLILDRFLEPIRLLLEKAHSIATIQKRRITVQIFTVTLLLILGSIGLFGLLIVESWQMIERESILREMRDDLLKFAQNLAVQLQDTDSEPLTEEQITKNLEVLRRGERGQVLILDSLSTLPENFSPYTHQTIREESFGIMEDFRQNHKLILFSNELIPGKIVVSVAYMKDFYSVFQETFRFLAVGALLVLVLTVGVITFMSFAISERARRLARLVSRAESGDVSSLSPIPSGDELDAISRSFIRFAAREKELQQAIEREKVQYEGIVKDIGEGLVVTDKGGKVLTVNPMACSLLGYHPNEVLGKQWTVDLPLAQDEEGNPVPLEQTATFGAIQKKHSTITNYYYLRKDGSRFPVHVTASPFVMEGKIIGTVSLFRDITEEKAIDRAKSEFVSIASHQLRTPLTIIRWSFEKLFKQEQILADPKNEKYSNQVFQAITRMNKLIEALLNVSRIELGTLDLSLKPINAITLAEQVIEEFRPTLEEKDLDVRIDWEDGLPNVMADPDFLVIVFQNLLSNAIKYSPDKSTISIMAASIPEDQVLFSVADTGYGIPRTQQDKIFSKLFRADNAFQRGKEGTGLGLYITKFIIEQSKGHIWFESEEGEGTTFSFTLPTQPRSNKRNNKKHT